MEAEQVLKIHNLRNFASCEGCEILQVAKFCNPAKFMQRSNFLQFVAPISFRLLTRISKFGLDSSCLGRLDDIGVFSLYNYKNSHKMR